MKVYDEPVIFPRPLVRSAWPVPLQCRCTWAWSPKIYGTSDKPYVLKIYYGLCTTPGHAARAGTAAAIQWEVDHGGGKESTKGQTGKQAPGKAARRNTAGRSRTVSGKRKGWHKTNTKQVRGEYL